MNFEVLNQILETASQTSLDVVSAQITKSNDVAMAIIIMIVSLMTAAVVSQMHK